MQATIEKRAPILTGQVMMKSSSRQAAYNRDGKAPARSGIVRRMARMAIAWLALGAFLGFNMAVYAGPGVARILAQMIAGMIVLSVLGMLLGLAADRGRESMIGGAFGAIVGILGGTYHGVLAQADVVSLCIVIGALIGATCWPWVRIVVKTLSLVGDGVKWVAEAFGGNSEDIDFLDTAAEENCCNTVNSLVANIQNELHEGTVSSERVTGLDANQDANRQSSAHTVPSEAC